MLFVFYVKKEGSVDCLMRCYNFFKSHKIKQILAKEKRAMM